MCELYSYCSYKGSPVGFRIGKTKVENEIDLTLCDDNINQFVRKSFESGMITCVFGKLPKSDKYVYLVKKLEYTGNNGPLRISQCNYMLYHNIQDHEYDKFCCYVSRHFYLE